MIMKKVYSLCKNAGMFNLIDDVKGGLQWLGNAEAYYPLEGCPIFDEDSFCATFDIPEKKREKWIVARHDGFGILGGATPYDVEYEEELRPIENVGMPGVGGLMALTNTERIWFIPLDCIEATGTSISELTFWARRDNRGMTYIAGGMCVISVHTQNCVQRDLPRAAVCRCSCCKSSSMRRFDFIEW